MTIRRKIFGFVVITALAISVLGVSSATGAEYTSTNASTPLTGVSEGHQVIDIAGTNITCSAVHMSGSMTGTAAASFVLTATYSGCKFLFVNVFVNMNGCAFQFNANGTVSIVDDETCSGIFWEGAGCRVRITKQSGLTSIGHANSSGGIRITPAITGIDYHTTGCLTPDGTHTNGNYTTASIFIEATNGSSLGHDP